MTLDDLDQDVAVKEMRKGQILHWMWTLSGKRGSQDYL